MLGVAVDLRWEQLILVAGVIGAVWYIGKGLRRVAKGLDRWDSIPDMAAAIEKIERQVVPPDDEGLEIPHLPLHQRVAVLEIAVAGIRTEMATAKQLDEHTGQDAENFDTIHTQLTELVDRKDKAS